MLDHLQKPRKRKNISKSSKRQDHKINTRARRILVTLLSCLLLFSTPIFFVWQTKLVFAKTTYVHNGQSIQVAINAAKPNDIIFVYNGTYNENLAVNQSSLTLIGQNPTTTKIIGTANGTVIRLEVSRITLSGFTICNGSNAFDAIVADHDDKETSDYHQIRNNIITTSQNGLYFHWSNNNAVENNTFYDNGLSSIYLLDADSNTFARNNITESTYGMRMISSRSNTIINNTISKTDYGIHLKSLPGSPASISNVIRNNTVSGKVAGVHIESDSNTVDHNTITDSAYGIQFQNAKNGVIYHNTLIQNSYGIRLWTTYPVADPKAHTTHTVYNNKALNNGWGIQVENSTGNTFWGNWLQENSWGVYLYIASSNTFYHNNFIDNVMQAYEMGGNQWNTTGQGNFWSDYTGSDGDGNGIGDTWYRIIPGKDYFPLMYTWSEHDIAVTSVTPSVNQANQGEVVTITVEVRNNDNITAPETFTVTAKYNNTIIGLQQVTALPQGATNVLYFDWNTIGVTPGNYIIRAEASVVTDELNTDNNSLTDGTVKIEPSLIGDINGDGIVNQQDLTLLQQAYGSTQGSSNWNPNADLNNDNTVDEQDLYILSQNYGQTA